MGEDWRSVTEGLGLQILGIRLNSRMSDGAGGGRVGRFWLELSETGRVCFRRAVLGDSGSDTPTPNPGVLF